MVSGHASSEAPGRGRGMNLYVSELSVRLGVPNCTSRRRVRTSPILLYTSGLSLDAVEDRVSAAQRRFPGDKDVFLVGDSTSSGHLVDYMREIDPVGMLPVDYFPSCFCSKEQMSRTSA
jgi:hypothetical protein